ncbi:hypothetical protein [Allorhizobium undicola]|uniref:hypothetical protein n=1 Tax=Allorhizobium undicola TaxID=78527 RepID=UPI0004898B87|nr:hypothetical protein [Allorhizobium undicola]
MNEVEMFSLWELPEITEAIVFLERNLAQGINSVSNPAQGSISYTSRSEAEKTLIALYRQYRKKTGMPSKAGKPRIFAMRKAGEY